MMDDIEDACEVKIEEEFEMILDDSMDAFTLRYFSSQGSSKQPPFINSNYGNIEEPITNPCSSSSKSTMISFGNYSNTYPTNPTDLETALSSYDSRGNAKVSSSSILHENPYDELRFVEGNKSVSTYTRTESQAQEHVLAERKRRSLLSNRFIALSAIIPGLKKMDKASVLGDAAKYIKDLQEHLKKLEEEEKKKSEVPQAVVSMKSISNCNEIEARVSDKNVLLRIHYYCNKNNNEGGVFIMKVLSEIEKLHLTIITTNVMPFANTSLLITINAQKNVEFYMTAEDLVKTLHLEILNYNISSVLL